MAAPKADKSRFTMYFAGVLLGLAAMVGIFQAKKAMMPTFHPVADERPEISITPGSSIRFAYTEEPGYFLPPGFPTLAVLYRKAEDGSYASIMRQQYGELADKNAQMGPLPEEGSYQLSADFYICAQPGVADCTKLSITQNIRVDRNATLNEDKVDINLMQLAQDGLKAGKPDDKRNEIQTPDAPEGK